MKTLATLTEEVIWRWLEQVSDPEVPVLTVVDLGVVRKVTVTEQPTGEPQVTVTITPTYSGCPAMDAIAMNIRLALLSHGVRQLTIDQQLSPAWTTDWMTAAGKEKLKAYGIAPPRPRPENPFALFGETAVPCPHCGSDDTELVSEFGATSCKSLYKCHACQEPFEHFKCH